MSRTYESLITKMNYEYSGDDEDHGSSLPGLDSYIDFVDAGCDVEINEKKQAAAEIEAIIKNGYRPSRLPVYPIGKKPTKEQRQASAKALKEIEETASTKEDYVDLCFYFGWTLIAERYYTFKPYYEDIHHEMMLAVCDHTDEYLKKGKGIWKPLTFFSRCMVHAACDFISSNICMTSPYYASAEKKINEYCGTKGNEISDIPKEEVAKGCGMSVKTVAVVLDIKRARRFVYLDNEGSYEAIFYMNGEQYWDEVVKSLDMWDLRGRTDEILKSLLSPFEYSCVMEYYGLLGMVPKKTTAIAKEYGKSYKDVCYALGCAKKKLAASPELKKGACEYVDCN